MLTADSQVWGALTLLRGADVEHFADGHRGDRVADERSPKGCRAAPAQRRPAGRAAGWGGVAVRASTLGDDADADLAVEPVITELAPLIAAALGLNERERAVTELVARGLSTDAIALRLHISPWTVQDHLKAIFEKVGVSTRGELIARLFFDHDSPRLTD